ncbi:phenolic acid decarboxylase [Tenacibaculum sp.]|nr:phenolic acid decarboxylase [Tenacibaculum sp.]
MKYLSIILFASFFILIGCENKQNSKKEQKVAKNTITSLKGKTITWLWTEGAFKGGKYEVSLLNDGKLHWKGLEGGEKGKDGIEKAYKTMKVADNIFTVSWLETVGYTVTVTVNLNKKKTYGIVSNEKEWYPLKGNVLTIK